MPCAGAGPRARRLPPGASRRRSATGIAAGRGRTAHLWPRAAHPPRRRPTVPASHGHVGTAAAEGEQIDPGDEALRPARGARRRGRGPPSRRARPATVADDPGAVGELDRHVAPTAPGPAIPATSTMAAALCSAVSSTRPERAPGGSAPRARSAATLRSAAAPAAGVADQTLAELPGAEPVEVDRDGVLDPARTGSSADTEALGAGRWPPDGGRTVQAPELDTARSDPGERASEERPGRPGGAGRARAPSRLTPSKLQGRRVTKRARREVADVEGLQRMGHEDWSRARPPPAAPHGAVDHVEELAEGTAGGRSRLVRSSRPV